MCLTERQHNWLKRRLRLYTAAVVIRVVTYVAEISVCWTFSRRKQKGMIMTRKARAPDAVDAAVGKKIRARRKSLGMTLSDLAQQVGITFQQFQKYETGKNRIGASNLSKVADILKLPISYFFSEPTVENPSFGQTRFETSELKAFLSTSEGLELNTAIAGIRSPKLRKQIVRLVIEIAENPSPARRASH